MHSYNDLTWLLEIIESCVSIAYMPGIEIPTTENRVNGRVYESN